MATRTRKTWKPGKDGRFTRQIGWQRTRSGKLGQVKFRLGSDQREARRREMMLVQLWEHVEQQADAKPATWPAEAPPREADRPPRAGHAAQARW